MKSLLIALLLPIFLFFSLTPSPALAQESSDRFVFGSNLTLEENEVVNGSLVVVGGNVVIPESSRVEGDLVVFGGNANVEGTITGDIATFGGNVNLTSTSVVEGDINVAGGQLNRSEGSTIQGQVDRFDGFGDDEGFHGTAPIPPVPPIPPMPPEFHTSSSYSWFGRLVGFIEDVTWNIGLILGLVLVGWLVAAFLPEQMQTVGETVSQTPLVSFGMGLLTAALALILAIPMGLLAITICLAIIPAGFYILLGIALLLGWIVIGQLIGERLLTSAERPLPGLVLSTVVGVAVLTVVTKMPVIDIIPVIGSIFSALGFLLGLIVAMTGLGAVVLTRFGMRSYGAAGGSYSGSSNPYRPYTPPPTTGQAYDRLARAEAELKAKIKAALAEEDEVEPTEAKPSAEPAESSDAPPKRKKKPAPKKTETDEVIDEAGPDDKPDSTQ